MCLILAISAFAPDEAFWEEEDADRCRVVAQVGIEPRGGSVKNCRHDEPNLSPGIYGYARR